MALHDPVDGGFAVDDVFVGPQGDVAYGDAVVVMDGGAILDGLAVFLPFAVFHLFDPVVFGSGGAAFQGGGVGLDGLIVELEISECPPGLAEFPKPGGGAYGGDAGELLGEVGSKTGAVVGRMQEAVAVIEQILLGKHPVGIVIPEMGQPGIGDGIKAAVTFLVVEVKGKALAGIYYVGI